VKRTGEYMKNPFQEIAYFYHAIRDYGEFIKTSERLWPEELEKYKESIESDNEKSADIFNYRCDLCASLSTEYPQLQRKSYLVMLMALFEDFMNQLCFSVQRKQNIKESLFDINDSGIKRAKKYLKKHTLFNFVECQSEWDKIVNAQSIRNVVVHAAGHINRDNHKKQLNIVSTTQGLDTEKYAREHLIIDQNYLLELVLNIECFCNKLNASSTNNRLIKK
jgi:hypothetical protein